MKRTELIPSLSRGARRQVYLLAIWSLAGTVGALQAADNFVPPRLTRPVEPVYPAGLHEAGVEGQVEAVFRVDRNGDVIDPDVSFATHPEFGEAVKAVLTQWRFSPARRDGQSVEQRVRMPILFTINADDPLSKWAKRKVFKQFENAPVEADEIGVWPEPAAWIEPYYPSALNGTGKRGEVVVSFVIDEHGDVVNPEVLIGDDPYFIASALAATLSLQFSPHMTDDGPVPVAMAVSYKFDERKQEQWQRVAEEIDR